MDEKFLKGLAGELDELNDTGLIKSERLISSPQTARVCVEGVREPVLNMCANNYLGLANHPEVVEA
ncbi:MAG: hypothetical protein KAG97_07955, partial [Victivallales bacterium]|nr:hypothetical protein [Victivallales bacterium]